MNLPPDLDVLLRVSRVGHLATVDEHARPHVVPVCYVVSGNVAYIALDSKPKTVPATALRRVRNLLANPHVQLLVDVYSEDWSQLAYVQLRGRAALLSPGDEHRAALDLLRAKYPQYEQMALEDAPLIRIEVRRAVTWSASAAGSQA